MLLFEHSIHRRARGGNVRLPFFLCVKNYILDTNVLLHDPNSLVNFEEHNVLVPIEVIEEIDRFKRESTELGRNARTVSRMLDGFRGEGSLSAGVELPNGGKLKIAFQKNGHGETIFTKDSVDNRILALAAGIQKSQPKSATILVSKDINLRIKANALGLMAEDYENDRVFITDLYTGMIDFTVSRGKDGGVSRERGTCAGRRQEIFSERILHAHRRIQSQESGSDQGGCDRHKIDSHPRLPRRRLGHQAAQPRAAFRARRAARRPRETGHARWARPAPEKR